MASVARLMGMECRVYEKDGQKRRYCSLHLCHVDGTVKGVEGCKCENVSCPRELDPDLLTIGGLYQLEFEVYQTKAGMGARLVDLLPVDESVSK